MQTITLNLLLEPQLQMLQLLPRLLETTLMLLLGQPIMRTMLRLLLRGQGLLHRLLMHPLEQVRMFLYFNWVYVFFLLVYLFRLFCFVLFWEDINNQYKCSLRFHYFRVFEKHNFHGIAREFVRGLDPKHLSPKTRAWQIFSHHVFDSKCVASVCRSTHYWQKKRTE
jgi:hypothetical protein